MVAASCRRPVAHGADSDSAGVRSEGGRVLSETERAVLCSAVWWPRAGAAIGSRPFAILTAMTCVPGVPIHDGSTAWPDVVTIETTRYCNLKCRMCLQFLEGSTVRGPHLGLDAFTEIAHKVFPFVKAWQASVSGEPLLTKDLPAMLAIADGHGVRLDLTTNGTVGHDRLRDALARSLRKVQFSFDSVDPELFAAIRVGARRDDVIANLRALRSRCLELRPDDMPRFGLSVTLMRDNVEQLPALVDFAATELEVDHVQVLHVHAFDEATRAQSLVHAPELARERIAAAADRAVAHGIDLVVHPLDEITELAATQPERSRPVARGDRGPVCDGLRRIVPRDQEARLPTAVRPDLPERIGYCHDAWNRTYVGLGGEVLPCCVPGAPVLGSIWNGDLPSQWNGALYRELRQRLLAREPAPVCRGCRNYRELDDPHEIAAVLGKARPPEVHELGEPSAVLDPRRAHERESRRDEPHELRWSAAAQPADAVLEFSTDRFVTLIYSTAWAGIALPIGSWVPPAKLWRSAPADRTVFWRVRSRASETSLVASGRIAPQSFVAPPRAGDPRDRS